jgi:hypothetical protein
MHREGQDPDVVRMGDPDGYQAYAARMSGAPVGNGGNGMMAPPYPLYGYGPGMGQAETPLWKRPFVTFLVGAGLVGAAWGYFQFVRPMMAKRAKKKGGG